MVINVHLIMDYPIIPSNQDNIANTGEITTKNVGEKVSRLHSKMNTTSIAVFLKAKTVD